MPNLQQHRDHVVRDQIIRNHGVQWSPWFSAEKRIKADPVPNSYYILVSASGHAFVAAQVRDATWDLLQRGSGGAFTLGGLQYVPTTGGGRLTQQLTVKDHSPGHSVVSAATMVASVKERFRLNITELAAVCNVERPTIYSWLSGITPKVEKLRRIQSLYELSKKLIGRPLERFELLSSLDDNGSLMDLLSQKPLQSGHIAKAMERLLRATAHEVEPSSLASRLRKLGFSEKSERDQKISARRISRSYAGSED